jgi:hypothetical protein
LRLCHDIDREACFRRRICGFDLRGRGDSDEDQGVTKERDKKGRNVPAILQGDAQRRLAGTLEARETAGGGA